jgi:hypothetical protein
MQVENQVIEMDQVEKESVPDPMFDVENEVLCLNE